MASNKQMLVLLLAAAAAAVAFLPALATAATEHWVGDDQGWTLGFNYSAWAATKQFKAGDTLVFKYNGASHTVVEVSGADFKACKMPEGANVMSTGQDQVTLDSAGRRWFVCSVGQHCLKGMKVKVNVLAAEDGAPSPMPPPPSSPAAKVQARLALAVLAAIAAVLVL